MPSFFWGEYISPPDGRELTASPPRSSLLEDENYCSEQGLLPPKKVSPACGGIPMKSCCLLAARMRARPCIRATKDRKTFAVPLSPPPPTPPRKPICNIAANFSLFPLTHSSRKVFSPLLWTELQLREVRKAFPIWLGKPALTPAEGGGLKSPGDIVH